MGHLTLHTGYTGEQYQSFLIIIMGCLQLSYTGVELLRVEENNGDGSGHGRPKPDLFTGESPIESAHKTWAIVQRDLAYALGANVHRSWTERLRISGADAYSVTLSAPTRFIASKVENSYAEALRRLWKKHDQVSPPREVLISKPANLLAQSQPSKDRGAPKQIPSKPDIPLTPRFHDRGHKRFTFDNFIVGPSNEFAFAVSRQVANTEDVQYNPIVIHGANGMGKTHLLYAIKQSMEASSPDRVVKLISGEQFVATFVSSLRGTSRVAIDAFKHDLRSADLLLIDDAHFITSKPGSQEELLHTLVSLVDEQRQVILVTDRHPDQMEAASDRLKSYLSSGLVCKIGAADYELRIRLLNRLIARRRESGHPTLTIPQNARDHLAARINATPRDLEGAFNQVIAKSEFLGTPITLESIQDTLSESRYAASQRLTVDKIQRAVAEEFGITLDDMVSKRRARAVARPRQVAMYLCKTMTKRSLPDIGRRFGGRDHTTVMHAVKRITSLMAEDAAFAARVKNVESKLKH